MSDPRACCPICNRHIHTYPDTEPGRGLRLHYVWHTQTGKAHDRGPCEGSGWLVEDVELLIAEMGSA